MSEDHHETRQFPVPTASAHLPGALVVDASGQIVAPAEALSRAGMEPGQDAVVEACADGVRIVSEADDSTANQPPPVEGHLLDRGRARADRTFVFGAWQSRQTTAPSRRGHPRRGTQTRPSGAVSLAEVSVPARGRCGEDEEILIR